MSTIKVLQPTDVGEGLEVSDGTVRASSSMTTDAELASQAAAAAATQAATDAAQDASATSKGYRQEVTRMSQLAATTSLAVTVSGAGIKLDQQGNPFARLILMGAGKGGDGSIHGYLDIYPPEVGTVVKGLGVPDAVVTTKGELPHVNWGTYYVRRPATAHANSSEVEWCYTTYSKANYEVDSGLIFVAQINHDRNRMYAKMFDGTIVWDGTTHRPDTAWEDLPFAAGVANFYNGYQTCQFKRANNVVYVRGLCQAAGTGFAGTGSALLANLPAGFRPTARRIFSVNAHENSRRVDVAPTGEIYHVTGTTGHTWVPLEFSFDIE